MCAEYLFTNDRSDVLHPAPLKAVLEQLHDRWHHVYVFLAMAPTEDFCIRRELDARTLREFDDVPDAVYTIGRFMREYDCFHPSDVFVVLGDLRPTAGRGADHEGACSMELGGGLSPGDLRRFFRDYLTCVCERRMRAGRPFALVPGIVRRYGFTPRDTLRMESLVARINTRIVERLQTEYEKLKVLSFIRR